MSPATTTTLEPAELERQEMIRPHPLEGRAGGYAYGAIFSCARPATDYPARIMAHYDGRATPLEAGWMLRQK